MYIHVISSIIECPCNQKYGRGETCEDQTQKAPGCYPACPSGQIYSTTQRRCFKPEECPRKQGSASGDPHYTTFDGYYYTIFDHCSHVSAEDCEDQTWSVYQITSNKCSRGRAPTCIDEVMVRIASLKTAVRFSRVTNTHRFIGNIPSTDDMIVTVSGPYFTADLPRLGVTVRMYYTVLTISVSSRWFGKVCGLFGTPDGDRNNEWMLRNRTVLSSYNNPLFEAEFRADNVTGACPEPIPPEPVPECSGAALTVAQTFCSAMSDTKGSYASCHATLPPGNTYEEPIDTPFEQCVYDRCVVGTQSGCTDILNYADACRKKGHMVGDPPEVCRKFIHNFPSLTPQQIAVLNCRPNVSQRIHIQVVWSSGTSQL